MRGASEVFGRATAASHAATHAALCTRPAEKSFKAGTPMSMGTPLRRAVKHTPLGSARRTLATGRHDAPRLPLYPKYE